VLEISGSASTLAEQKSSVPVADGTRQSEAELQARIAARQPFLDFVFSRDKADGSQQQFRVSGEPMFNESCRFIGYRGIGVEITASN
jgi:hypothetical protein